MQITTLNEQCVGKTLGHTIYDSQGRVLLRRGVVLSPSYVKNLRKKGYTQVYVQNELAPELDIPQAINEDTRAQATRVTKDFITNALRKNSPDIAPIHSTVDSILDSLKNQPDNILNLTSIKTIDDYTFEHCVNVCTLSLILMRRLTDNKRILTKLGKGALLHDIGKLSVPLEILLKPTSLNNEEYEEVKQHTIAGYNVLNQCLSTPIPPQIALQHHERIDGKGYPLQLNGDEIHSLARIVSVADVFDAVTSSRPYQQKMKTHKAMEMLLSVSGTQIDKKIVNLLIKHVAHYPVGSILRLDSDVIGVVERQDEASATRPHIRLVVDPDGAIISQPEQIALSEHPEIEIEAVLDDYPEHVQRQIRKSTTSALESSSS